MGFQSELQELFSLHGLASLLMLTILELILGIDNIIFISLLLTKVPEEKRFNTRVTALSLAFLMRLIMLFSLVWLSHITTPLFTLTGIPISIRDVLFLMGGTYLVFSTFKELLSQNEVDQKPVQRSTYKSIILQVVLIDMLFSFDSIFTAIGLISNFLIMALAIGLGMVFMVGLAGKTSAFIEKNQGIKTLALSFIIIVGLMLLSEGAHLEPPKKFVYAVFGVALLIERIYNHFSNNRHLKR